MKGNFVCLLVVLCCSYACRGAPIAPPTNSTASANVQVGFYSRTCPQAEGIVRAQVQRKFLIDKTITPALLRMLFHDSFVRGADASILLDSTPGHQAEKEALPNLTIRGFDLINEVKDALEEACPGVVSCADVIVLAVRDSVALAGGPKYEVPTGRLDGKVSLKEEALNLPSPAFPVEQSQESFRQKGLDLEDMVALLGAHTVGVALCGFFNDRLFNFHGTGAADPTMNPQLVMRLSGVCPNPFFTESNADPPIVLDQFTPAVFDSAYYSQILAGNGILQIDQEITDDPSTVGLVKSFTSTAAFFPAFVRSIIKMGNIGVKTGVNPLGEVRRKCNVTNSGAAVIPPAKPPAVTKPAPAVSKPAPGTKPSPPHTPISKPAPVGHVTKPPTRPVTKSAPPRRVSNPPPVTKPFPPGHVSRPPRTPIFTPKPPTTPVAKPPRTPIFTPKPPTTPVTKRPPPGHAGRTTPVRPATKPRPPGHVSKPAPPVQARKRSPARRVTKPPRPGHVSKPASPAHVRKRIPVRPVTKAAPPRRVRKPAPPARAGKHTPPVRRVTKPPGSGQKPATPVHGGKRTPVRPITKPVPTRRAGKSPIPTRPRVGPVTPAARAARRAPPAHVIPSAKPPGLLSKPPVATKKPAPPGHVSTSPHTTPAQPAPSRPRLPTPVAKPEPGARVTTPPAAPPRQVVTSARQL